ncbi:hypothetical protein EYF80_046447 [Liparis tanakae]|uniref:Uncharacterized protein n=1 Tax=Liparis tanakae TaxID=230148 RepID=A0A4Z2FQD3_9TELE|nr:hypothetical protein EYF80_046447 [Liparis tanakae]
MSKGTNTCRQASVWRAGELQSSVRPALLLSRAPSSDPLVSAEDKYQNSRQASPSSLSGPLSRTVTTASSGGEEDKKNKCLLARGAWLHKQSLISPRRMAAKQHLSVKEWNAGGLLLHAERRPFEEPVEMTQEAKAGRLRAPSGWEERDESAEAETVLMSVQKSAI